MKTFGIRLEANKFNQISREGSGEITMLSLAGDRVDNLEPGELMFAHSFCAMQLMSSPELRRNKNNGEAIHDKRMGLRIRAITRNHVDTVIKIAMKVYVIDHSDIPFCTSA